MEFTVLKTAVQKQFKKMAKLPLFQVELDKDKLWELYLASFPEGTNPLYQERTFHDCSCCRHFIKTIGNIVAIEDGQLISLWDVNVGGFYQVVADTLSEFVKSHTISGVFVHCESSVGVSKSFAQLELGTKTWEHFHIQLPTELVMRDTNIGPRLSETKAMHDVLLRSLKEISIDAVDTVLDLVAQNSLYRGAEKKRLVAVFKKMLTRFNQLDNDLGRDLYAWENVQGVNAFVCKIRNDVIGTLLVDISKGMELEVAVKHFEDKVSGTNYKRTTALVTPKMKEAAKQKLIELDLISALERRFATLPDISINDVLFADRNAKKAMGGDIFDDLPTKAVSMKKIYIIGDMHTVSAFRLSGITGVVSNRDDAPSRFEEVIGKGDAGIVVITNELAEDLQGRIAEINLGMLSPAVIEIPGIDDALGFRRSAVGYISEALGIAV